MNTRFFQYIIVDACTYKLKITLCYQHPFLIFEKKLKVSLTTNLVKIIYFGKKLMTF